MIPKHFLGIPIKKYCLTIHDLLNELSNKIAQKKALIVLTINLHSVSIMKKDHAFHEVYKNADQIIFDGISTIWLARLSGIKNVERIGHDFLMKFLYELAQQKDWSFYFLGGARGIAEEAANKIKEHFPSVRFVGYYHGYFDKEQEVEIIEKINECSPDILAVGLGMPYQEKWIYKNRELLKVGMITNCGAYIEQTANKGTDYYPDWAYRYNLNWFYRILQEPRKLWKRYLFEGMGFIFWVPKYLLKKDNLSRPRKA